MAIVRNNAVTEGFSGMLGNQLVFRQFRGKTIVAKRPKVVRRQSERQRVNRKRFQDATAFAKAAMCIPEKKAYYWKMAHELALPNAYTAAITEYMRGCVVKSSDHGAQPCAPVSGENSGWSAVHGPQCTADLRIIRLVNSVKNQLTEGTTTHLWTVDCRPWTITNSF